MTVYADHAATTRISAPAREAMLWSMDALWGNPSSLHTPGQKAKDALERARETVAAAIHAGPREIYFTAGGTEADNQAILSAAMAGERAGKKHIIASAFEHHAVLHTLARLRDRGFAVTLLDVHPDGHVRPEELKAALRPDTALVTVMYVNNEVGTVQPVRELGAICREAGVCFHTDAVQAVGHLPVDVVRDRVDMLSLSGHKFGGPRGVGALYVRQGTPLYNLMEGGAQERGKRPGTENLPAIVGMAAALEAACAGMEAAASRLTGLRDRLVEGVTAIPGATVNGGGHPGIVNVCFAGVSGESLLLLLDRKGVCASAGSACTSGALEPSHVLRSMGVPEDLARGALRLSLGPENTAEEVEYIIEAVTEVVNRLRNISPRG